MQSYEYKKYPVTFFLWSYTTFMEFKILFALDIHFFLSYFKSYLTPKGQNTLIIILKCVCAHGTKHGNHQEKGNFEINYIRNNQIKIICPKIIVHQSRPKTRPISQTVCTCSSKLYHLFGLLIITMLAKQPLRCFN